MNEMRLSQVINECNQLTSICHNTGSHAEFMGLVDNPQLATTLQVLNEVKSKLQKINHYLRSIVHDSVMQLYISFKQKINNELKSNKMKWIRQVGLNHLEVSPLAIAENLDDAERIRNEFIRSIWQQGINSVKECEVELKKLSIIESSSYFAMLSGEQYRSARKGNDVEATMSQLNQELKEMEMQLTKFRELLYQRKNQLDNIHHFFLMVGRLVRWYRRTIKQLPTNLLPPPNSYQSSRDPVTLTNSWQTSVKSYLLRHPSPKQSHVERLKETLPLLKNINLRNQTRLLVYRLNVLIKLLSDERLTLGEYREILTWQSRQQKQLTDEKELLETVSQTNALSDMDSADAESRGTRDNSDATDSLNATIRGGKRRYKKRSGFPNVDQFEAPNVNPEQGISIHRSPVLDNGSIQPSKSLNRRQRGARAKLPRNMWSRDGYQDELDQKPWSPLHTQSRSLSDQNIKSLPYHSQGDSTDSLLNGRSSSMVSDFSIFDDNLSITSSSQIDFSAIEPPRLEPALNRKRLAASLSDLNSARGDQFPFNRQMESKQTHSMLKERELERRRGIIKTAEDIAASHNSNTKPRFLQYNKQSTSLEEDDDDLSEEDLGVVLNELCSTFTKDSMMNPHKRYSYKDDPADNFSQNSGLNSLPTRRHTRSELALWNAADDDEIPENINSAYWGSSHSLSPIEDNLWYKIKDKMNDHMELEATNELLADQMYVHRYDRE